VEFCHGGVAVDLLDFDFDNVMSPCAQLEPGGDAPVLIKVGKDELRETTFIWLVSLMRTTSLMI
jgi:hypothetical protein